MKNKKMFRFVFNDIKLIVKNNKLLSLGLILSIAGAVVLGILPPLVLEKIVNNLAVKSPVKISLAFEYFLLFALAGILNAVKEVLISIFGQKTTHTIRTKMCKKLCLLPSSFFTKNDSGVTASKFVNDVDMIDALFSSGVISMVADACQVVGILAVIMVKSLGLGIMMIAVTPLIFIITRSFQKRMLKAQLDNRKAVGTLSNHIPETILNIRMIHSFSKEEYMKKRYNRFLDNSYEAVEKSNFYDSVYSPIIILISAVIIAIMMILSACTGEIRTFFGMSVGTAVAVIAYVGKIFSPIESIGMEIQNIQSAAAGIERIEGFLHEDERKVPYEKPSQEIINSAEYAVEFKGVDFSYDENEIVLNNFNLKIKNGENVTLVGRTGAGKSTVFKLIMGLFTANSGKVEVFGIDASNIADSEKRKIFGIVEQSFYSVNSTVAEQISLFDENIGIDSIRKATRSVGLDEYICGLSNGYETQFDESLFSKGQLQLLAIARAVVTNPPLLLLDEITANIDSCTENEVITALINASKNRTVVSISHRLYENGSAKTVSIG